MATISLHLDFSDPQDLAEARDFCDYLLAMNHADAAPRPSETSTRRQPTLVSESRDGSPRNVRGPEVSASPAVVAAAVDNFWGRTGLSHRAFMKVVAENAAQKDAFSLKDLADSLDQRLSVVKSRWASLGRSIRAARDDVPGAPRFLEEVERRDGLWHFTMPEAVREAVLLKELNEPYADGSLPT